MYMSMKTAERYVKVPRESNGCEFGIGRETDPQDEGICRTLSRWARAMSSRSMPFLLDESLNICKKSSSEDTTNAFSCLPIRSTCPAEGARNSVEKNIEEKWETTSVLTSFRSLLLDDVKCRVDTAGFAGRNITSTPSTSTRLRKNSSTRFRANASAHVSCCHPTPPLISRSSSIGSQCGTAGCGSGLAKTSKRLT